MGDARVEPGNFKNRHPNQNRSLLILSLTSVLLDIPYPEKYRIEHRYYDQCKD
jgi:hypothetical protein